MTKKIHTHTQKMCTHVSSRLISYHILLRIEFHVKILQTVHFQCIFIFENVSIIKKKLISVILESNGLKLLNLVRGSTCMPI